MTKALVTGGAGFMGSHLAEYLAEKKGYDVVVLDDLSGGFRDNVPPASTFVEGSITDRELVDRLFAEHRFDVVFHLAAYAAEGLSHFIKRFNYENNLIGSINLLNASVNFETKRFIYTSSIAVYGSNQLPMIETLTPKPEDSYGIAKFAVEQELAVSHEMFGLEYVVFRPHNVYGERQNLGDRYRNVIGIFMNNLMSGRELPIFGDGEQQRAFTYIGDIVPGIADSAELAEAKNQVFNIGSDQPTTVNQLAEHVMTTMGIRAELRHLPARNEVVVAYSDHSKYREVFAESVVPDTPLEKGLRRMAEWAAKAGVRSSAAFENIEIAQNMPPSWRSALSEER